MARRSQTDNVIIGMLYVLSLPFIAAWWLICGLFWVIGKIILHFTKIKIVSIKILGGIDNE